MIFLNRKLIKNKAQAAIIPPDSEESLPTIAF
jgi:hypothetical protein